LAGQRLPGSGVSGGTLDRLADLLTGEHDRIVRGDDGRAQVTAITRPILQRLMASGLSPSQAMTKMLADD